MGLPIRGNQDGEASMKKNRPHRLREILKEGAPGPIHTRLETELGGWAGAKGFVDELHKGLPSGRPDIFRCIRADSLLFIGDAKDSENEDAFTFRTYTRISGYLTDFANFIADGRIEGGIFAVATDKEHEANDWAYRLSQLAADLGLSDDAGDAPNFQVTKTAENTWVAWW